MAKEKTAPASAPAGPDDYHGVGGSYVIDPTTGKRELVEPATAEADAPETKE